MSGVKLTPFDAAGRCPKCGHDDVTTAYKTDAHCDSPLDRCVMHALRQPDCCDTAKSEHFHRYCQRCRFWWAEAVRSADEAAS